jgi:hypothetical protein
LVSMRSCCPHYSGKLVRVQFTLTSHACLGRPLVTYTRTSRTRKQTERADVAASTASLYVEQEVSRRDGWEGRRGSHQSASSSTVLTGQLLSFWHPSYLQSSLIPMSRYPAAAPVQVFCHANSSFSYNTPCKASIQCFGGVQAPVPWVPTMLPPHSARKSVLMFKHVMRRLIGS